MSRDDRDTSKDTVRACRPAGVFTLTLMSICGCGQPPPADSEPEAGVGTTIGEGSTTASLDGGEGPGGGESETGPDATDDTETETGGGTDTGDDTDTGDETETGAQTDDAGAELDLGAFEGTLYPLADGAIWTYLETTTEGQVLGEQIVEAAEIEWDDEPAWMLIDSPDGDGEWTESVLVRDDELVIRVHEETLTMAETLSIVDYDPGLVYASDEWLGAEVGDESEFIHEQTETDGDGDNEQTKQRGHVYTVMAVDEPVAVPAGNFDCVKIKRVRSAGGNVGEIVYFWYAEGVGKIREERPAKSRVEELTSVNLPNGVELP